MIEAVKDYLAPKRFHIVAYVCVIVHFLCGSAFTVVTAVLRASENGKFSCFVDGQSTVTHKKQVDQACFLSYDKIYNSPLPFYGFVLLSTGSTVLISVIYSLVVWKRVDEIESYHERRTDGELENQTQNRRTVYVFYSYFVHLVLRALFGIIFTMFQYAYFYPNGFDSKFSCNLSDQGTSSDINTPRNVSHYSTLLTCKNATASEKSSWGIIVSVLNSIVAFIILVEVIYLWRRFLILNRQSEDSWNNDSKFVTIYFFGKQCIVPERHPLSSTMDKVTQNAMHSIQYYKNEVKNRSRAYDINYPEKISLDDMYIDVIIHTERARHKFSKDMDRHEIYDVYMKVPSDSIRLEKIKDLFYPNKDTQHIYPRSILAIGRPGIGKTILTEKLLCDWANEIDEFYLGKIVFFFKLRLFDHSKFKNISLKTFLQLGTRLDTEKIESIYQKTVNEPEKAIFIFDGLDECNAAPMECLDQSNMNANDCSECMSGMSLFIKLVRGDMLKGATVLVTSRPTAYDFYSKLDFDRNVEIIGFTSDKIEEYVSRFCKNKNRINLKQTIWNHIKSASELLNLCYIPVNCLIMCATLYECLNDLENDTNVLPKTLTELYEIALHYVGKKHQRNANANCSAQETFKKLELVAFNGIKGGKLVFEHGLFDEQMKASGLLNHLSASTVSPGQFCFTHLTLQEFLAARHVTETFAPAEIRTFISDHIRIGKWHLVLQFISGLLGKKIIKFRGEYQPRAQGLRSCEYKDCISAFVEGLEVTPDRDNSDLKRMFFKNNEVLVMKCLREVNNEKIVEDVCETTILGDVVELRDNCNVSLLSSEWAAVTAVCKHMTQLAILSVQWENEGSFENIRELLQKRCMKKIELNATPKTHIGDVFSALTKVNCTLKHRHTCNKLTALDIRVFSQTDKDLPIMRTFFVNGHGSHLKKLHLSSNKFCHSSEVFKMLNSEYCPKLAQLRLSGNAICDKDAKILWDALTTRLRKLTTLDVSRCMLTNQYIPSLCKALQDEHCQLTGLSLGDNKIGDKGARRLFKKALKQEHCKLTKLCLDRCWLTYRCISPLVEALQDERCQLTVLSLRGNKEIGDVGVCMLLEKALGKEHCKLTELYLDSCWLTDRCVSPLVEALQDERCQLTVLSLKSNKILDAGACMLFKKALGQEHCKLTELYLNHCWLTDLCVPAIVEALQDKRCRLTYLDPIGNNLTEDGERSLRNVETCQTCKDRGLRIRVSS